MTWVVILFILGGLIFAPRLLAGIVAGAAGIVFFGVILLFVGAVLVIGRAILGGG